MRRVLVLAFCVLLHLLVSNEAKSFTIGKKEGAFLKDGKPFRYVSGTLLYFRIPWQYWKDRMLKMRAAGFNVLDTYIEWRSHEPEQGTFVFTGNLDVLRFIKMAHEIGFLVIIRPGPYIGSERDMGGLPYWLMKADKDIELRLGQTTYLNFVDDWIRKILQLMKPLLYSNGGPIISVQIENQYGSHYACDTFYTAHLRYEFRKFVGDNTVLFTTDGPMESLLNCGAIEDVYATVAFGAGYNVKEAFDTQMLRAHTGPKVNSEFYVGWFDFWGYPHAEVSLKNVTQTLEEMLEAGASVNIYVFHGGTSFGFNAGSTRVKERLKTCTTSYDYDALLTEAGDPTEKYFAIRNVIGKYLPLPNITLPKASTKMAFGPIKLGRIRSLMDLFLLNSKSVKSTHPLTFEELGQENGFVLYKTKITFQATDPSPLSIPGLQDRGYIYINGAFIGVLSRGQKLLTMPVMTGPEQTLTILVEEQGRAFLGTEINDYKGITENVTLGGRILSHWTMYTMNVDQVVKPFTASMIKPTMYKAGQVPAFYGAEFILPDGLEIRDTFLEMKQWSKGVAYLNGINLGRYWPIMGPQETLYVPSVFFHKPPKVNMLVLLELESAPCKGTVSSCTVTFKDKHVINGNTPHTYLKKSK